MLDGKKLLADFRMPIASCPRSSVVSGRYGLFAVRATDDRASWVQRPGEAGAIDSGSRILLGSAVAIGRRLEVGGREFGIRFAACRGELRWGLVSRSVSQQGVRTGGP